MDRVYVLQHEHDDDTKFIGVYRTADAAQAAIQRLTAQAGFRDHPDGFCIDEYILDKDHWTEGFVAI